MQLSTTAQHDVLARLQQTTALDDARVRRAEALGDRPRGLDEVASALGLDRSAVLQGVADVEHMPFVDLATVPPAPEALATMSEALARRHTCLPLYLNQRELTVAVGHADWQRLDDLRQALAPHDVIAVLADAQALALGLDVAYGSAAEAEVAPFLGQGDATGAAASGLSERPPIVKILDAILERAVRQGASDVHLEPEADASVVRFRVDGMLRPAFRLDASLHEPLISRLKVLAELNIADRVRPQDGRLAYVAGGRTVDVRVSTLRVTHGEKAVLRLLGHRGVIASLAQLGMPPAIQDRFEELLAQPYGLILVTGPTGSGKTSTLYAALNHLACEARNIVTLEDPVEVELAGIHQVPVRPEIELNFATALRAVLRQDPDVVMVGEVRDQETAEIAMRGALTGHLMLSTLHANDTAETIARLLEMGVAPWHLAPALLGVVAQRMARRLCACHGYRDASPEERALLGLTAMPGALPLPVPRGCLACDGSGFAGRVPIFELLEVDEAVRRLIQQAASADAIRQAGFSAGMSTLWSSGMRDALAGRTTLEEVRRVVRRPR